MLRRTALLALASLITLGACSSDEGAADATTLAGTESAPEETGEAPADGDYECTDPLAGETETVDAYELIVCTTLTMAETEGYVTTSTVDETQETTLRVDTDPMTVEVTYPDESVIIANATDAWVKESGGEWVHGDVTSGDYLIAQATQVYETYRNSHDPAFTTAGIPEDTTYTVEGTEEIDGVEYRVLSAQFDDGQSTSDLQMWVGPDYEQHRVLATITSPESDPMSVDSVYSEWDTPQDITLPE